MAVDRALSALLRAWAVIAVMAILLGLFRLTAIGLYHGQLEAATGAGDLAQAAATGLRFDLQLATLWCLPLLLLALVAARRDPGRWAGRLAAICVISFVAVLAPLAMVDIGYFREYHDQFDAFLFNAAHDDQGAILSTIWSGYPVFAYLAIAAAAGTAAWWGLRAVARRPFAIPGALSARPALAWGLAALLLLAVVPALRGSLGLRPVQIKDAGVTPDRTVNAWVQTPVHALQRAWKQHRANASTQALSQWIPDRDLARALARADPAAPPPTSPDAWLLHRAAGSAKPPRHVILLVMESFDGWPLLPRWRHLGITPEVAALGAEGLLTSDAVAVSTGTMASLSALLTGLPDVGVYTAWKPAARQPFPTSLAPIFRRLGYRTRFFYSGLLTWQRIGDLCRDQGFEEIYGGGHMGNPEGNEWGVDDQALFAFAAGRIPDDVPSLDIILSTSNHPPYSVDLAAAGWDRRELPAGMEAAGGYDARTLGHLWYSDRCAGAFIRSLGARLRDPLFALTADHWSRRSPVGAAGIAERACVPLLLHGPAVLAAAPRPVRFGGGQLDLLATLIERCAPSGFAYHALGEDLLVPRRRGFGIGAERAAGPGWIGLRRDGAWSVERTDQDLPGPDPAALERWYRAACGLGWQRIMRGDTFAP